MKSLDLFIKALEINLSPKRGKLIYRTYQDINETYPAYVTVIFELYNIDGDIEQLISKEFMSVKQSDTEAMINAYDTLTIKTICNTLRHYGI